MAFTGMTASCGTRGFPSDCHEITTNVDNCSNYAEGRKMTEYLIGCVVGLFLGANIGLFVFCSVCDGEKGRGQVSIEWGIFWLVVAMVALVLDHNYGEWEG